MTDIVERLYESDEANALTNEAALREAFEAGRAAEREAINVAVTKLKCGYKPDDPLWHTVDHVAEVLKARNA